MTVNGCPIEQQEVEGCWVDNKVGLKQAWLKDGKNVLEFLTESTYDTDQYGLIRVRDPDGDEYFYIQTVPYYANRVIPIFDQPDLKGFFALHVVHNQGDHNISTGSILATRPLDAYRMEQEGWFRLRLDELQVANPLAEVTALESTPKLASYLLNLVSGPFAELDSTEEQRHRNIPMRVYCRSNSFSLQNLCRSGCNHKQATSSSSS